METSAFSRAMIAARSGSALCDGHRCRGAMDPNASESVLQNTSLDVDPAVGIPSPSNPTGFAALLLEHGRQLQRLTTATDATMSQLQAGSSTTSPGTLPPRSDASRLPPGMAPLGPSAGALRGPRLSLSDKFNGRPELCRGFLMQCELFLRQQPHLYPTEEAKVAFLCSLFTGEALEWLSAKWVGGTVPFDSYAADTVASYAVKFRTLAAQTDCTQDTLKQLFRHGLSDDMQKELACRDEGRGFEALIQLAIRLDHLMRSRRPRFAPEPIYLVPVTLMMREISIQTQAMLDSGAAGNFIDLTFAHSHRIPLLTCNTHVAVSALDGRPLGSGQIRFITEDIKLTMLTDHHETIRLFTIDSPRCPIILGLPWLERHNPSIDWSARRLSFPSSICVQQCFQAGKGEEGDPNISAQTYDVRSVDPLPVQYRDLHEVFNKQNATKLLPRRPCDCAIDLLPGATPGRGRYRYPLPLVPAALEQLRTARYYTKLDLRSAYNLIRIRECDEWKTAFSTTTGYYEYLVIPFGLCNAPSVFQCFINDVFRDMLNKFVIVYIDDILVFSDSFAEHVSHVRQVLKRLIAHQLCAKREKCEFNRTSMSFLGYIISEEGVAMDQSKVEAVLHWPQPTTVRELQRFLGFANFYRRFIRGFSSIVAPLTSLLRGAPQRLSWVPETTQAFEDLKARFAQAPVHHHPDPKSQLIVEVGASGTGIGAVLSQRHGHPPKTYPCAYLSRKLTNTEKNYDVGDRELLAMKEAFGEWRHWLEGASLTFLVLTDHRNLEYIRTAKRLNPRQARLSLFSRFQFQITYRLGSKNGKADALSRLYDALSDAPTDPEPILPPLLLVAPVHWDVMTEIAELNAQNPPPPSCPTDRTYVPPSYRQQVLHLVHDTPAAGHPGIDNTQTLTTNVFWWPTVRSDVAQFVKQCSTCQMTKAPRQRPAGLLQPLPIPLRPWSHVAVDFVTDLPRSQGNMVILTVVERFSKSCRLIPLPKLPSALETAEHLLHHVFHCYGLPEDIVSDQEPQFTSRVWRAMCDGLGINISLTSGYHPQSNGQAE
uniref:Gypsy retrotransposon integrase-like protein 1 n=1 Tax=Oryzias melastigma TaxID=30732 RepID=A0A3B3D6E4_ORYME